jgi:bla regulator protein blaR1
MTAFLPGFFDWLLRCSFQASILIVLVLTVLAIVRRRIPARWQCLLWAVVLVRLMLPWAPQSRLSVFNWLPARAPQQVAANFSPDQRLGLSVPGRLPEFPDETARRSPLGSDGPVGAAAAAESVWTMRDVLRLAWLIPAVCLAAAISIGTVRLWRGIRCARPVLAPDTLGLLARCSAEMGLTGPPGLVQTTLVRTPCLFGIFRPLLLLPEGLLDQLPPERLRHVFLHELAHMKRHDVEAGWLLAAIQVLHWFNPLVWVAFRRFRSDRELACDAMAMEHLRPDEQKRYAETLIELVQGVARPALMPSLAGIFEGQSDLKRRIIMISTFGAVSRYGWVSGALLIAALAGAGLTDAKPAGSSTRPAVIADSPDSYVDASGRIVDKTDYPFVDDPQAIGKWESVDFVPAIKDFDPASPKWKGDLFLKELVLLNNGRTAQPWWRWTKGLITHKVDRTASKYAIKDIGGTTYMFFEWKSGDYAIRYEKPSYYVLKKVSSDVKALEGNWSKLPSDEEFNRGLQAKVDKLDIDKATLDDVTKLFGEPGRYYYGTKGEDPSGIVKTDRDHLPEAYVMEYPAGFFIFMAQGRIGEIRFHQPGYRFKGKLQVGDSVEDALKAVGQPSKTVNDRKLAFGDAVLYMDVDGKKGYGYYQRTDQHVRMFFSDRKVSALYVTRPGGPFDREGRQASARASDTPFSRALQEKADKLDLSTAKCEDIVKTFGEPTEYVWGSDVFKPEKLPSHYIMSYPDGFSVFMADGQIVELRFGEPNYAYKGKLKVGSSMEDAFKLLGQPDKTVTGEKNGFQNGVYYKDVTDGGDYYARKEQNVRMFAKDGKVLAIYVTRPGFDAGEK